jgi:hypothetical protein
LNFYSREDCGEDGLVNIGCFLRAKSVCVFPVTFYFYVKGPDSYTIRHKSEKYFASLFVTYSLAVDAYKGEGEKVLRLITTLHKTKFEMYFFSVQSVSDLIEFRDKLEKAVQVVSSVFPFGLTYLVSRRNRISFIPLCRKVITKLYWFLETKLRSIFYRIHG